MSTILVYDIQSSTWFSVTASGDQPGPRRQACSVAAVSPDESAFHITMYGGWNLFEGRSYEDVYVLSIPSFTWINITDQIDNKEQDLSSGTGRDSMGCSVYKNSQMIVLGGEVRDGANAISPAGQCNNTFPAARVLDLTTYTWQHQLNTSLDYRVPTVIYNAIGGK